MKTKTLLSLLLLSLFTVTFTSCDKDDDEVTKTELLTKSIWNWEKVEVYSGDVLLDTEYKTGYTMKFDIDHTAVLYEPDGNIEEKFQWDLNSDETKLSLTIKSNRVIFFDLILLTNKELVFSFSLTEPPGISKFQKMRPDIDKKVFYFKR